MKVHEKFMKKALEKAKISYEKGEVPIGAVIVKDGVVLSACHNQRNGKKSAIAHAEILAIEKACKKVGDWRLDGADIYVTLEPCPMCAGAIVNARINAVYFGAYERKSGAVLSNHQITFDNGLNHKTQAVGGILEEECSSLLKKFFMEKRKSQE